MPLSSPLLPTTFVHEVQANEIMRGYSSAVYEQETHAIRLKMRSWTHPTSPDFPVACAVPGFTTTANRTSLHLHAHDGDVLALSEFMVFGATVDGLSGITPLQIAYQEMTKIKTLGAQLSGRMDSVGKKELENSFNRLAWCARILIEQHANISKTVNGASFIDLSCDWNDWTTLAVLLKHGAWPSKSQLRKTAVKLKLVQLTENHGREVGSRPPRVCPCWSGLTVANCHGLEDKPYPLKYICPCGSNKVYQLCCHKRGSFFVETWDTTSGPGRLMPEYAERRPKIHIAKMMERLNGVANAGSMTKLISDMLQVELPKKIIPSRDEFVAKHLKEGVIDAAFAYALARVDFTPR